MSTDSPTDGTPDRIVILNPNSGTGDHASTVRELSESHDCAVHETEAEGDAIELAREAGEAGAELVAAAGGDGTINEVVRGLLEAEALDRVTFAVVPCGTGNDFAGNIGVIGIEQAFDVLADGERRQIDLGMADDRPFVNSCVGGMTADASAETSSDMKRRFGRAAYVLSTLRALRSYEGVRVAVDAFEEDGTTSIWSGNAVAVLIGNGRRFPPGGSTQANVEDGQFDVTLVRETDSLDLVEKAALEGLLGQDTEETTRFQAPALEIDVHEDEPIAFSLDGEIVRRRQLSLRTRPGSLHIAVGDEYDPTPEA